MRQRSLALAGGWRRGIYAAKWRGAWLAVAAYHHLAALSRREIMA
jgi:hypothetical protein